LRPESGARFRFERLDSAPEDRPHGEESRGERGSGEHARGDSIECEVLQIEPNKTLRWRQTEQGNADSGWQPVTSVVTIELTDVVGGGTHLRLVHGEFSIAPAAVSLAAATTSKVQATVTPLRRRTPLVRKATDVVCQLRRAA
jgi:uncharacterized protein YndB with AHSA1/START domain